MARNPALAINFPKFDNEIARLPSIIVVLTSLSFAASSSTSSSSSISVDIGDDDDNDGDGDDIDDDDFIIINDVDGVGVDDNNNNSFDDDFTSENKEKQKYIPAAKTNQKHQPYEKINVEPSNGIRNGLPVNCIVYAPYLGTAQSNIFINIQLANASLF
ncbi:hypothetical protein DERP_006356 [Dermatophagoides pteronyssinus]|uniref:Uncharacterized protein n=1 Tax=Dermatophagoides pteronyssinus TaxID=6956 RepID=A0ABQ8IY84_DERPT|nr:hypothetical protein DERP_006356 [Dermatophagoides pteronyssinus]